MKSPIWVVGIGPEGPTTLSPKAQTLIMQAQCLVGGRRHLAHFADHPAAKRVIAKDPRSLCPALDAASRHGHVVVLASGDPNFFGIAELLRRELGHERVMVLPHLSSVQLACARIGLSWHDMTFLSAHGRTPETIMVRALKSRKLAILTDAVNTPAALATRLLAAGMEGEAEATVCESLGLADERICRLPLKLVPSHRTGPLNLLLIERKESSGGSPLALGLPESDYAHSRGLITKAEVRVIALSRLRLRPFGVLWDIGSGSGSVALEAADLVPNAHIYAIERDPAQFTHLLANQVHLASPLIAVLGDAPAALAGLSPPHAVFIGGSHGKLEEIFQHVARHLLENGHIVANFVTLEHLLAAKRYAVDLGLRCEVLHIAIARSGQDPNTTRLTPLNPIFMLIARKEASL